MFNEGCCTPVGDSCIPLILFMMCKYRKNYAASPRFRPCVKEVTTIKQGCSGEQFKIFGSIKSL